MNAGEAATLLIEVMREHWVPLFDHLADQHSCKVYRHCPDTIRDLRVELLHARSHPQARRLLRDLYRTVTTCEGDLHAMPREARARYNEAVVEYATEVVMSL